MLVDAIILTTMIQVTAMEHAFNPDVAVAVSMQESNMNPRAVGKLNEQGLYQLRPMYFKQYTVQQLKDPAINMELGISYLAKLQKTCIHRKNLDYLVCFNGGPEMAKSIKHPSQFPYVVAVKKKIKLIASL